ncbi:MAG: pseudaminic acid synthase [Candidatus Hermodarchaeia archaeon]|jgi:N-acetylneuraminate synthase
MEIMINNHKVGLGHPTYIVAEMSANHNGDFNQAAKIIEAAKEAGADAIKVQTYTPDTITIDCDNEFFRIKGTLWEGRTLFDLYGEAYTPWEWQPRLKRIAEDLGLDFFSSAFDPSAVDFLEEIGVAVHKVASFEIVDIPLIEKMAITGKPLIISTGMATLGEIEEAVQAARRAGANQIVLLKCTSAYPAQPEEINLRAILHLGEAFGAPVGLSDHTMGIAVPVTAVGLGACVVEKHFTLSREFGGPDSAFSLEPTEFKEMVNAIRVAEKALGEVRYEVTDSEAASRVFRRSLFVVKDVKMGDQVTSENVRSIRPGYGLHPRYLKGVLNREFREDIPKGTPLEWNMLR